MYKSKLFQAAVIAGTLAFSNGAQAQVTTQYDFGILVGTYPSSFMSIAPDSFGHNPFAHLTVDDFGSYTEYTLSINNNLFSSFGAGANLRWIGFDYIPAPSSLPASTLISSNVAGISVATVPGTTYNGIAYDFGDLFSVGIGDLSFVKWSVNGIGNLGSYQLMNSLVSVGNVTLPGNTGPYTAKYTTLPVPEPETYAMLLAGLGLLGFTARRRKS